MVTNSLNSSSPVVASSDIAAVLGPERDFYIGDKGCKIDGVIDDVIDGIIRRGPAENYQS